MQSSIVALSVTMSHAASHTAFDSIISHNPSFVDSPPCELSMYASSYYSLLYISEADSFPVRVNDTLFSFKSKHLYLFPPFVPHSPTNTFSGSTTSLHIKFFVYDDNLDKVLNGAPKYVPCSKSTINLIEQIKNITLENPQKQDLNKLTSQLLRTLINSEALKNIEDDKHSQTNIGFSKLIKHLYEHYKEDLTLSDMASFVHMEKAHFAKKFKSLYNITPINYLYSLRLTLSFDNLIHTNLSIAKVAESVGFKNVSSYCTAFKRAYGVSPGEYRNIAKRKQFSKDKAFSL